MHSSDCPGAAELPGLKSQAPSRVDTSGNLKRITKCLVFTLSGLILCHGCLFLGLENCDNGLKSSVRKQEFYVFNFLLTCHKKLKVLFVLSLLLRFTSPFTFSVSLTDIQMLSSLLQHAISILFLLSSNYIFCLEFSSKRRHRSLGMGAFHLHLDWSVFS